MARRCLGSDSKGPDNFPLRAGVLLISAIGLLAFVLASSLLLYSMIQVWKKCRRKDTMASSIKPGFQPISVLFLCAIFTDVIHGTSNILSIRWAFAGEVTEGPYCTAQGVLRQIGSMGVALYSTAIAVLTYLQVLHSERLGARGAKVFVAASICFITGFITLIIAIPVAVIHPYFGDVGMWCGIMTNHRRLRIVSGSVPPSLAVPVTVLVYGMVAYKWACQASFDTNRTMKRDAIAMGWYPIAYLIVAGPQGVASFIQRPGIQSPVALLIFPQALYASWGALNVILWFCTGRHFGFSPVSSGSDLYTPGMLR
ncbi:uncharacterized protein EI90DRAFT_245435 [Cantharellus anzutake]|uniref:uncharacterized protein n=1 Tax=Cantharellus anzutake TaxID=1750568 RepID=UPI0019056FB4|nr:uncharacterized protein EI90DRAFT_245435 [Cantharellus anzutake]KAF8335707.1 hypothetical protein EI90DRAFT_245435 [Cantharellus anzutake]